MTHWEDREDGIECEHDSQRMKLYPRLPPHPMYTRVASNIICLPHKPTAMIWTASSGLRIIVMDIPNPVAVGDSVELTCSFDLEGDSLYSVKFYKNQ